METSKTSRFSWQKRLGKSLTEIKQNKGACRTALLGIGNELNGDDGAGPALARRLTRRSLPEDLLVVDAGLAPENFTGLLRRFQPDLLVLVDAAGMAAPGTAPGAVCCLDFDDLVGFSGSTHLSPLTLFQQFVSAELGCEVILLGIQPGTNGFGQGLSPAVRRSAARIARYFEEIFGRDGNIGRDG